MNPAVLVVDDDAFVLGMVQKLLALAGYRTLTASSAAEGLELARDGDVGLILMDDQMPGMTGREAVRRLRDDPRTNGIPVVLLTGVSPEDIDGSDFTACLPKPFPVQTFYSLVAELLGRRSS